MFELLGGGSNKCRVRRNRWISAFCVELELYSVREEMALEELSL